MSPLALPCTFHHVCTGSWSSPGRSPGCSRALGFSEGMWDVLSAPCFPHSRCSQVPLASPGAQRSLLLETASMMIPHGTKQALGNSFENALCVLGFCLFLFPKLLPIPLCAAGVGLTAISPGVGWTPLCSCAAVMLSHCRASSAAATGKVPAHRSGDSSLGSSHSGFLFLSTAKLFTCLPCGLGSLSSWCNQTRLPPAHPGFGVIAVGPTL